MRWRGREQSSNIEDRRGQGGGLGGGFGRGGFGFPGGSGGGPRIGIPTGGRSGGDRHRRHHHRARHPVVHRHQPAGLLNGGGSPVVNNQPAGAPARPTDEEGQFVAIVLADTEDTWGRLFKEGGKRYRGPDAGALRGPGALGLRLRQRRHRSVLLPGRPEALYRPVVLRRAEPAVSARRATSRRPMSSPTRSAITSRTSSASCRRSMRRGAGRARPGANQLSVRLELQADCLAGVWAHDADAKGILEVGDIDEALNAAAADRRRHAAARRARAMSSPTASPTAPRRSAASGSSAATSRAASTPATPSG